MTARNLVRAGFVRFLALGGDEQTPVHERGVWLKGAWLEDELDLEGATADRALRLWHCSVHKITLQDADLKLLDLGGCHLDNGLDGDGFRCRGGLYLRHGFEAIKEVRLLVSTIEGDLDCSGARFENPTGDALSFDGAHIHGHVYLSQGLSVRGHVRLTSAVIGGNLECTASDFEGNSESQRALTCDRASISGSVFLSDGFRAKGEVRFVGARIGGNLGCIGGEVENKGREALSCDRITVAGSVVFQKGFCAEGRVRLVSASIGGNLECISASFINDHNNALVCQGLRVHGAFFFKDIHKFEGGIDLSRMHVGGMSDDLQSWKIVSDGLILDGFTYDRFATDAPTDARSRIAWLDSQHPSHLGGDFKPQPWDYAGSVLRAIGHADEARQVAIAKHRRMRAAGRYVGGSSVWDWLYGALVGYGYRPWRLLWIAAAVWIACAGVYSLAIRPHWLGSPGPILTQSSTEINLACVVDRISTRSTVPCPRAEPDYRNFVSLAYSAEVLLPVISVGSKAEWRPTLSTSDGRPLYWGWILFLVYWLEIAFGWLAGLLLVAAFGNLIKKE